MASKHLLSVDPIKHLLKPNDPMASKHLLSVVLTK